MKKFLVIFIIGILLFGGCIGSKTEKVESIENGDGVSIDYIGTVNGKIFDTSIESVAKENNLSNSNESNRKYGPLRFIVGAGKVIKGLDEGVVGMKVGESKILTIPPEDAYGIIDPELINIVPIMQNISTTRTFSRTLEISKEQFDDTFGENYKVGDSVQIPESNVDLIVQNRTDSNVTLLYNLTVGYEIRGLSPWKEIVTKIDDINVTTVTGAKKNDTVQLKGAAWNTTIVDIDSNSGNMIMRHNKIPDTKIRTTLGQMSVHFNDTHVRMDLNNDLAGDTLIFNVTVRSLDKLEDKKQ